MTAFFSPVTRQRWRRFRSNRRGSWSLLILLVIFCLSLGAEFVANDRPIVLSFQGDVLWPVFNDYPETRFGGTFETATDYRDPYVRSLIMGDGWMVWPPVPFRYDTVDFALGRPAPSAPDARHWLGTDDQGRDVFARVIYGLRLSLIFAVVLTALSSLIGILAGAVQGYLGGLTDLIFQRVIEVWSGLPQLFILIILSAVLAPGFLTLLLVMLLFSWTSLVSVVRAEVFRARSSDYVLAGEALGLSTPKLIVRHILPNALVASLTYLPFLATGAIVALTSLDFLGLGMPPGSPSLGEMLRQGKNNLNAPWLALTGFISIAGVLTLLVFIGEAVRDAFDPRKPIGDMPQPVNAS